LVERGVPLSQVRDLLGHASITTTERYDNQKPDALMEAAKRLETGESFTIASHSTDQRVEKRIAQEPSDAEIALQPDDLGNGVDDGTRTRNLRCHRPAL